MAGIYDLLFGGGAGGGAGRGPMSLTPAFATPAGVPPGVAAAASPAAGAGGFGGFLENLPGHLQNPLVAAGLGIGGGLMSSADQGGTFGQGLRAGVGGGLGSYIGAQGLLKQREEEEERKRTMQELIDRLSDVAGRARGGGAMAPAAGGGGVGPGVLSSYGGLI